MILFFKSLTVKDVMGVLFHLPNKNLVNVDRQFGQTWVAISGGEFRFDKGMVLEKPVANTTLCKRSFSFKPHA